MSRKNQLPAAFCRGIAVVLAFLLTACLAAALASGILLETVSWSGLHEWIVTDEKTVDLQMDEITEKITALAEEEGFDAEPVIASVSRESVEELNRAAVRWWTEIGKSGRLGDAPEYSADGVVEVLEADEAFTEAQNELMVENALYRVRQEVEEIVLDSAVKVRTIFVDKGMEVAREQVDLSQIVEMARSVPWLALSAAFLLTGLIALMVSRKIGMSAWYIGAAMVATGIVAVFGLIAVKCLGIGAMIEEASVLMTAWAKHLGRILTAETIGAAVILWIAGFGLMRIGRSAAEDAE